MASHLRFNVALEQATTEDIPFLSALAADPAVTPFLMPRAGDEQALRRLLIEGSGLGRAHGLFVIRSSGADRVGGLALQMVSQRSRICDLSRLMIRPDRRRAGIATAAVALACHAAFVDHGLHRIQAEVYGDNLAGQALFERVGFMREGTRRRAYWRRGRWLDGVLFGMLAGEHAPPARAA